MDVVGGAASVVALVEISLKVLSLIVDYSIHVKSAKEDIARFRLGLEAFVKVLRSLHELAQNPEATNLVTFRSLAGPIQQCKQDLEYLQERLEPGKSRKAMSKYGVRALKWPFERKELDNYMGIFERYKSTFNTALNADQISLILEAKQDRCLSKLAYAAGANFDSNERENEPYCLPHTRVEILSQIMKWSADPCHKSIFWLNGMAGTGKSTIARTIARTLTEQKQLAANFFFSRGRGDLSHAGKLVSTIAIQLAATYQPLKHYICEAIAEHEGVSRQSMRDQWRKLIYQPISKLKGDLQAPQILVFVFDALDECGRQEDIRRLFQLLTETKDLAVPQFRILVTSRPEIPIQLGFHAIPGNMRQDFVLHSIARPVIQHDIAIFLKHEMKLIRDDHSLPSDWPDEKSFGLLVERSGGLFIYAATVCRFIQDHKWCPVERLDIVLQGSSDGQLPEQRLDEIYIQILRSSVFGDCSKAERDLLSQRFRDIMGLIIILSDSLSLLALKSLFPAFSGKIDITLKPLKSVLDIPDDQNAPVQLLHPSFRDFLLNPKRCQIKHFGINKKTAHHDVAEQCLHLMSKTLGRNICQLETPGSRGRDIDKAVLNQLLPSQLQYACQYWVGHLQEGVFSVSDAERVYLFLRTHFLHWLEALSLMGKTSEAVLSIIMLGSIPEFEANADLVAFLQDAKRFILEFRNVIETAPLQLYNSALIFSPESSVVKGVFSDQMPKWIENPPKVEKNWTPSIQTLEGHLDAVNDLAFSPDGHLLASGSDDSTIKLWSPITGDSRGTLEGHSNEVSKVVFSPDGQLLASASYDLTVRFWDPVTGDSRGMLEGHSSYVGVVVFSPDGQLLASGSGDNTVKLWDPVTGDLRGTLEGHSGHINALAFSPNSQLLASGSDDSTVRLWDPVTRDSRCTLEGHSRPVFASAFSPDGQLLVSGSAGSTVRLWNPVTGDSQGPLEGHLRISANAVVFSPDSQLLASGSNDGTVWLWDPITGDSRGTLEGHSSIVNKVVFSPDGQLLASASWDLTIRLWDPIKGDLRGILEGHSGFINALAFSPNSQLLASGSDDSTVRLWDPVTRDSRSTLESHLRGANDVVFSPDSQLLVCRFDDGTVSLWDLITGDSLGTLEGHTNEDSEVVFSPDGQLLASGSRDSTVRLWDSIKKVLRSTLEGHSGIIYSVAFSPDGHLLASGSQDSTVKLWDSITGNLRGTLEGHSSNVYKVVFSPNGHLLASGSSDWTVRLWDPVTRESRATLEGHSDMITAVAFSPNGSLLASGSHDRTVRLWDPVTEDSRGILEGHSSIVRVVVFSPDGHLLASGSDDNTVRLWLIEKKLTLQCIEPFRHIFTTLTRPFGAKLHFSSDGLQLVSNGSSFDVLLASLNASPQKKASVDALFSPSNGGQWVTWKGCDVLWLPFNRRPGTYDIKDNTYVIVSDTGQMTILSFSTKFHPF